MFFKRDGDKDNHVFYSQQATNPKKSQLLPDVDMNKNKKGHQ